MTDSLEEIRFAMRYRCVCGHTWATCWSCACDDDCPKCGTTMSPEEVFDLSGQAAPAIPIDDLRTVLDYCMPEEEDNYEEYIENGGDPEGHIYTTLKRLADAIERDAPSALPRYMWRVTIPVDVMAENPLEAARFALEDLRDRSLGDDWNTSVELLDGQINVEHGPIEEEDE